MSTAVRLSIIGALVVIAVLVFNADAFAQVTGIERSFLRVEQMVRRLAIGVTLVSLMVMGFTFMLRGGVHGPALIGVVIGGALAMAPDTFVGLFR